MARTASITRDSNRISVVGRFRSESVRWFLWNIHDAASTRGFKDLVLDLTGCSGAFADSVVPVCVQVLRLRQEGVDCLLELPPAGAIRNLFINTNWANLIDPENWDPSTYKGYIHVPATRFATPIDQYNAVDALVNAVLGSVSGLTRSDLAAIEWALNEVTDNVLIHANSPVGGLIQVTTFRGENRHVDFVVADAGIGIPDSLRTTNPDLRSDSDALDVAIREGVTRDKAVGQGNGLFGTLQICRVSGGVFSVSSGFSRLFDSEKTGLHIRTEKTPFTGTVVAGSIDCAEPELLEKALSFGGKPQYSYDYLEKSFEDEKDRVVILLCDIADSFGSRLSGQPVRIKLENLLGMYPGRKVYIDFDGVPIMSSSFADEVFGKLFLAIGPTTFLQRIEFTNLSDISRGLIDRALGQRMMTGM